MATNDPDPATYRERIAPPAPTLRNTYALREYNVCPSCHPVAVQETARTLVGQRRGMAAVAILGTIGFGWIVLTAFLHSDVLGRPLSDTKGWIYATPQPAAHKDPLRGLPSTP